MIGREEEENQEEVKEKEEEEEKKQVERVKDGILAWKVLGQFQQFMGMDEACDSWWKAVENYEANKDKEVPRFPAVGALQSHNNSTPSRH